MRCQAITHSGVACARAAMRGAHLCASHAGRCGARPGNRNALRRGPYSRSLSAQERLSLAAAGETKGLDEAIAVTRLMLVRALRQPNAPPAAYARLADALCRQLRLQRQLASDGRNALEGALGTLLDMAAGELARGAAPEVHGDQPSGAGMPPPRMRPRRPHVAA